MEVGVATDVGVTGGCRVGVGTAGTVGIGVLVLVKAVGVGMVFVGDGMIVDDTVGTGGPVAVAGGEFVGRDSGVMVATIAVATIVAFA